jgi:enoyl-CoA hydratase/carnithine racemase
MPRLVWPGMCTAAILTGEIINASEALRIGLIHRVVSRADLIHSAERMARLIMSRGQIAVRCSKEAINRGLDMSLEAGLEMESELFAMVLSTDKVQTEK